MTFLEKLDWLMQRDGLNKHTLALKSGIPYTTIVGIYKRGSDNIQLSTINRLCAFFHVPLDYLMLDKYDRLEDFSPKSKAISLICYADNEIELVTLYRCLSKSAKTTVLDTVRGLYGNPLMRNSNI